jgi:hypothetical protein
MTPKALKILCLGILVLLLGIPSFAQNTKGDKPATSTRETRFKTPKKQKQKRTTSRRVRRGDDRAGQPAALPRTRNRTGERPGKPIGLNFSKSKPDKQKAWKGDITGRRIRPRSSAGRASNVHPQPGTTNYSSRTVQRSGRDNINPNLKRIQRMQRKTDHKAKVGRPIRPVFSKSRPPKKERSWSGDITGRKLRATRSTGKSNNPLIQNTGGMRGSHPTRSRRAGIVPGRYSGRAKNVYSTSSFWSRKPQNQRRPGQVGAGVVSGDPGRLKPGVGKRKLVPRSASASYISRRSTNPWAHFRRPKRKQEKAITTDLAGRKLRGKNFETQRPVLGNPTLNYRRRMAAGERPYNGPAAGGRLSRPKSGQRAWKGDVARRAIRGGKPPRHGERAFLGIMKGRGPARGAGVATYKGNIRVGRRGFGDQGEEYSGSVRARRALKGGGSVSGRVWNNKGLPILGRTPGKGSARIGYQGNIRVGKRGFSDQGEEYSGNIKRGRRGFGDQGEEYRGNIRRGRRGFGDQGEEYSGNIKRGRRGFGDQGEEYSGNIKRGRRGFSDQGEEYTGNLRVNGRKGFSDQGEEYTGNIKSRRPDKGGGSRSGKLWNNNRTPIAVRVPSGKSSRIAGYQGNIRAGRKGFSDQGEEYTGDIKARRPEKGGGSVSGKIWNNGGRSLPGKDYSSHSREVSRFTGNYKAKRPEKGGGSISGKLWNNNEKAILVRIPKNKQEGDFTGRGVRRNWDYIKNPSSADAAQRTREPGKAFHRAGDYQGNIKLKKFDLSAKKERHPDARFVKTNKNNVDGEKGIFTNFKLWWARLFRKSETQPDHLKEKGRKPRYDSGESGLWYE